jgi:hypothetical protein
MRALHDSISSWIFPVYIRTSIRTSVHMRVRQDKRHFSEYFFHTITRDDPFSRQR